METLYANNESDFYDNDYLLISDPENDGNIVESNSEDGKRIIENYSYELNLIPYKKVYLKDRCLFLSYCSILFWALENIKKFNTVGNRKKLSLTGKRLNSLHLGWKKRCDKSYVECVNNATSPPGGQTELIYELLGDMAEDCFPNFEWTQILINKNNLFKKHKDSNNIKSDILVFSLGDFKGDLHIEDKEVDTCLNPIIFNGKERFHSVPKLSGLRYSILFYVV